MKKILALVLALAMLATCLSALAATVWETTPKSSITITGVEKGDEVVLYKIIGWDSGDSDNWKPLDAYSSIADINNFSEMSAEKAQAIAAKALADDTALGTFPVTGDTFTKDGLEVGMYLALVKSGGTQIYNPMIISVNYATGTSQPLNAESGSVNASSTDFLGTPTASTAIAKKTDVVLDKEVDDSTEDADDDETVEVGDVIPFVVTSTIPVYSSNWQNLKFEITDTLSTGLTLVDGTLKVKVNGTVYTKTTDNVLTISTGTDNYTVSIDEAVLKALSTTKNIEITYDALVGDEAIDHNVDVMTNTVKVKYSNNPNDSSDYAEQEIQTHHYTFSIDADLNGEASGQDQTSELLKIGMENGESTYAWNIFTSDKWYTSTKLAGAEFRLYRTDTDGASEAYDETYTTEEDGRIVFEGLEEGTYILEEVSAPAGYVKESGTHTVVIAAETYDDVIDGVTHKNLLKSYTITIDGNVTSTYSTTNVNSEQIETNAVSATSMTLPIVNTKGLELPSTGGVGTTLFYIFGGIVMLAAGIVLVARRKAEE